MAIDTPELTIPGDCNGPHLTRPRCYNCGVVVCDLCSKLRQWKVSAMPPFGNMFKARVPYGAHRLCRICNRCAQTPRLVESDDTGTTDTEED